MANKNNLLDVLSQSIIQICNRIVEKAKYNKTYKCRVVSVESNNMCKIQLAGKIYNAHVCCSSVSVNDWVWATICQNNYKDIIVIKDGG